MHIETQHSTLTSNTVNVGSSSVAQHGSSPAFDTHNLRSESGDAAAVNLGESVSHRSRSQPSGGQTRDRDRQASHRQNPSSTSAAAFRPPHGGASSNHAGRNSARPHHSGGRGSGAGLGRAHGGGAGSGVDQSHDTAGAQNYPEHANPRAEGSGRGGGGGVSGGSYSQGHDGTRRSNFGGREAGGGEMRGAGAGPGGGRSFVNANHLLNFQYEAAPARPARGRRPTGSASGGSGRGSSGSSAYRPPASSRMPATTRMKFLQANFRFMVSDAVDIGPFASDADKMFEWEDVIEVEMMSSEPVQCPISLDSPPICPQITPCGHIYSFPAIMQHLVNHGGEELRKSAPCPLCFAPIVARELRLAKIRTVTVPKVGDTVMFTRLQRGRDSILPHPAGQGGMSGGVGGGSSSGSARGSHSVAEAGSTAALTGSAVAATDGGTGSSSSQEVPEAEMSGVGALRAAAKPRVAGVAAEAHAAAAAADAAVVSEFDANRFAKFVVSSSPLARWKAAAGELAGYAAEVTSAGGIEAAQEAPSVYAALDALATRARKWTLHRYESLEARGLLRLDTLGGTTSVASTSTSSMHTGPSFTANLGLQAPGCGASGSGRGGCGACAADIAAAAAEAEVKQVFTATAAATAAADPRNSSGAAASSKRDASSDGALAALLTGGTGGRTRPPIPAAPAAPSQPTEDFPSLPPARPPLSLPVVLPPPHAPGAAVDSHTGRASVAGPADPRATQSAIAAAAGPLGNVPTLSAVAAVAAPPGSADAAWEEGDGDGDGVEEEGAVAGGVFSFSEEEPEPPLQPALQGPALGAPDRHPDDEDASFGSSGQLQFTEHVGSVDAGGGTGTPPMSVSSGKGAAARGREADANKIERSAADAEKAAVDLLGTSPTSQRLNATNTSDEFYFYQSSDGQWLFLHPLSLRCLLHAHGGAYEACPPTISAKVLELEDVVQCETTRKRWRFLAHLPLQGAFKLAEVQLAPLLTADALAPFAAELALRDKRRRRKASDETRAQASEAAAARAAAAARLGPSAAELRTMPALAATFTTPATPAAGAGMAASGSGTGAVADGLAGLGAGLVSVSLPMAVAGAVGAVAGGSPGTLGLYEGMTSLELAMALQASMDDVASGAAANLGVSPPPGGVSFAQMTKLGYAATGPTLGVSPPSQSMMSTPAGVWGAKATAGKAAVSPFPASVSSTASATAGPMAWGAAARTTSASGPSTSGVSGGGSSSSNGLAAGPTGSGQEGPAVAGGSKKGKKVLLFSTAQRKY